MKPCAKICWAAALKNKKMSKKLLTTNVLAVVKIVKIGDQYQVIGKW
jgi:hypothetical protein